MIAMFIICGLANIALFLIYSKKVGSVVNAITIFSGLKFAIEFVLEPLSYYLGLYSYDVRSIVIINVLSLIGYAAFVFGLLLTKQPENPRRLFSRPNYLPVAWMLLLCAWAVYSPILIEFQYLLAEPRQIYEATRTGYGLYTFGSSLLTFLSLIVFMMSTRRYAIVFYIFVIVLMALKGAKGQFIILAAIYIIAKTYLEGFKYSLTRSVLYGSIASLVLIYIFAVNYRGETSNIIYTMAEYSDYNRNGALVVQDGTSGYYQGKIMAETLWIPKIPRAVWEDKPKVFGEFRLAMQYYPQWFMLDQGSPSFGLGVYFADFGRLAFLIYPIIQLLSGYLLGRFLRNLIVKPNAFYFVMSLYLAGSNLLAVGSGAFFIEHAVIGLGLATLLVVVSNLFGRSPRSAGLTSLSDHGVARG